MNTPFPLHLFAIGWLAKRSVFAWEICFALVSANFMTVFATLAALAHLFVKYHTTFLCTFLQPGGGQVKIEHRKLEWNTTPRTKTVNSGYAPGGGDKKVRHNLVSTYRLTLLLVLSF